MVVLRKEGTQICDDFGDPLVPAGAIISPHLRTVVPELGAWIPRSHALTKVDIAEENEVRDLAMISPPKELLMVLSADYSEIDLFRSKTDRSLRRYSVDHSSHDRD
jgi:hypothetical protein